MLIYDIILIDDRYDKKNKTIIKLVLEKGFDSDNLRLLFSLLIDEELILAFNNNHLCELEIEKDKRYIPLFTDEKEIPKDFEHTRLDKVKLDVVIRDIYSLGYYHAISINPYNDDFIMNKEAIELFLKEKEEG